MLQQIFLHPPALSMGGAYLYPEGSDSRFDICIEITLHHFDTVFKPSSSEYVTLRHLHTFSFLS